MKKENKALTVGKVKWISFLLSFISILAIGSNCALSVQAPQDPPTKSSVWPLPKAPFKKVFIVVLENVDKSDALTQPFLGQLAKKGALLNNYFAITHPSQPNYVALVSGDIQGVTDDEKHNIPAPNIGDLLETHHLTWKSYAESYPGNCFTGMSSQTYYRKHVPFISFTSIQNDQSRCSFIVNASQFDQDLTQHALPDYSFYAPDINDDGHNTSVSYADTWLSQKFGPLLNDPQFMQDLLFVVTFDEGSNNGNNQIFTVLYGDNVVPGSISNTKYDHYSLLRTIEDVLGLGTLGMSDSRAHPISDVWKSSS